MARATRIRSGTVQVEGIAQLSRALKAIDPELQKGLRGTNKDVASFVADHARGKAQSLGSVAAKTAPSISAVAGVRSAGVGFGGSAYPFAGGAEFGSVRYTQFQPWRGNGPEAGYFVYPTIRDDENEIVERYAEMIDGILREHFPY